jgi:general secretion pathway protein L
MSWLYSKVALGAEWDGEELILVALGRRLRNFAVLDWLRVSDPEQPEAGAQVAEFVARNQLGDAPVVACLPRAELLVRFLDLPAEAETQLTNVISYQIDVLHPFRSGEVYWDAAVVARDAARRQIQVLVVVAEKSRADRRHQLLSRLGLRADTLTLAAACLTPVLGRALPEGALVLYGRKATLELLAFHQGDLRAARELSLEGTQDLGAQFERELHGVRAAIPSADPARLPAFACGSPPAGFSEELLPGLEPLPALLLRLSAPEGFDPGEQLGALAGAYAGLRRKLAPVINLLPAELRQRPERWARVLAYALAAPAVVLAVALVAQGWIETELYARVLNQQVQRLEPQALGVREQSQQVNELEARAARLAAVRQETWRKLVLLRELTEVLPNSTWLQEAQVSEQTVEIFGYSDRAADLVQPLENSPLFARVEFTAPITRDAQNKEIFRLRMRLESAEPE